MCLLYKGYRFNTLITNNSISSSKYFLTLGQVNFVPQYIFVLNDLLGLLPPYYALVPLLCKDFYQLYKSRFLDLL